MESSLQDSPEKTALALRAAGSQSDRSQDFSRTTCDQRSWRRSVGHQTDHYWTQYRGEENYTTLVRSEIAVKLEHIVLEAGIDETSPGGT
jgi:hypothetical protein